LRFSGKRGIVASLDAGQWDSLSRLITKSCRKSWSQGEP